MHAYGQALPTCTLRLGKLDSRDFFRNGNAAIHDKADGGGEEVFFSYLRIMARGADGPFGMRIPSESHQRDRLLVDIRGSR
jgi:hypothetical protein